MHSSRRQFLFNVATSLAVPYAGCLSAHAQTASRLHALIIGINTYTGRVGSPGARDASLRKIPSLLGCVNDAESIAAVVRPVAETVEVLLNEQVSRSKFLAAWSGLVARSQPGDVLLVSYSGHGGQEQRAITDRVPDGLYDTFIMPDLDTSDQRLREERIVSEEMQGLLASVRDRNKVIFVADSCHAGGMARAPLAQISKDVRYRTIFKYGFENELRAPIPVPASDKELSLPHVMFLSGAEHSELVPELILEGKPHGALSVAFASAMSGLADEDGDGVINGLELSSYVLKTLRTISNSAQHPNVRWPRSDVRSGRDLTPGTPLINVASKVSKPRRKRTFPAAIRLLNVSDQQAADIRTKLKNAIVVAENEMADFYWDGLNRTTADGLGSVLAYQVNESDLQDAINATILTKSLQQTSLQAPLPTRIQLSNEKLLKSASVRSDQVHREGTALTVIVDDLKYKKFVLFNIAGNGVIQLLFPVRYESAVLENLDPVSWDLKVQSPFGADHVVAVSSDLPLDELLGVLKLVNGQKGARALSGFFETVADNQKMSIGVQGIYTSARE